MQLPVQISFRGMEPSAAVEAKIRERTVKLERFYDRIMGCRVVVESPHRHHHQGKLFHVRVYLTVPGGELTVSRDAAEHHAHEDVFVAVRDACDAAQRQLEDYARRQRGDLKTHEGPPSGHIAKLFPDKGYGFIETPDGFEIYFHQHSVLDAAFDRLLVGSAVEFVEEEGEKGPQASTVRLLDKR
jgi:cold shock CspA family protein/ribosome-associated translation inhibitor RaiA